MPGGVAMGMHQQYHIIIQITHTHTHERTEEPASAAACARTRTGEGVRAREGERTRATCSCAGRYSPADPRDSLVQPSPVSKETTSACKARGLFEGGHPAENTYVEARSPGKLQACSLARCARRGSCRGARHPLAARQSSKRLLALATLECSHGGAARECYRGVQPGGATVACSQGVEHLNRIPDFWPNVAQSTQMPAPEQTNHTRRRWLLQTCS